MWHVSVARIHRSMIKLLPLKEWPGAVKAGAEALARRVILGRGQDWEFVELGDSALHLRRRLSVDEMKILYKVDPLLPVFTHGKAMEAACLV